MPSFFDNCEPPKREFRSWGEAQIGRMLNRYGVPYLYEHPVAVIDAGKTRIWYPDFQLRGCGVIIEYCGRPHDPVYAAGMARKESTYRDNGITALMITPNQFRGPWPTKILDQIEEVLGSRLQSFRALRIADARSSGIARPTRNARDQEKT